MTSRWTRLRGLVPQAFRAESRRGLALRAMVIGVAGIGALAGVLALARAQGRSGEAAGGDGGTGLGGEASASLGPDAGGQGPAQAAAAARSSKVRVVFKTVPPVQATVNWGKKRLGIIKPKAPLIIDRVRDSGPLDVVIHADGCLPVHSRVYTFTDSVLAVKMTPLDKKNTLFGYREAPPPEEDGGAPGGPDAGAP